MIVIHVKFLIVNKGDKVFCNKCQFKTYFQFYKSLVMVFIPAWYSETQLNKARDFLGIILPLPAWVILSCCETILVISREPRYPELCTMSRWSLFYIPNCAELKGLVPNIDQLGSIKRRQMYRLGTISWINISYYVEFNYSDSSMCTDLKRICYW